MPGGDYQEEMEMNNNTEMQFQENSEPPHHEPGHATGDMGSSRHQADEEHDHTANGQSTHDMQGHDSMAEHHENMQHADHAGEDVQAEILDLITAFYPGFSIQSIHTRLAGFQHS